MRLLPQPCCFAIPLPILLPLCTLAFHLQIASSVFATTLRHIHNSATTSSFSISADLLPLSSLQLSNNCQSGSLPSLASAATSIFFKSSKSSDCSDLYSMADIKQENMQPSSMSLPPPPQFTGAPGQQQYENGTTNGQGNPAHMPPPPLPPVVIPQNTNPIPTAMTSPGGDSTGMLSPSSGSGGFVRRAAPEPNKRALYVGGLDPRVTEDILRQIFETTGHVQNVKIIPDKNMGAVSRKTSKHAASLEFPYPVVLGIKTRKQKNPKRATERSFHPYPHPPLSFTTSTPLKIFFIPIADSFQSKGFNYGFIEYDDPASAERAMQTLNGRRVHQAVSSTQRRAMSRSILINYSGDSRQLGLSI